MTSPFVRPRLYQETLPQQNERIAKELVKASFDYTLEVVKKVSRWFESRRMAGREYDETSAILEAWAQCHVEGINPAHVDAAAGMIVDIYLGRG